MKARISSVCRMGFFSAMSAADYPSEPDARGDVL